MKKISVDKQLLRDCAKFREALSKNVAKRNQSKSLTGEELDESAQRMLDRLIFIRNCEDRELEAKTLIAGLREWKSGGGGQLIKSLRKVFDYFSRQYNSDIFAAHLCDDLEVDNEVLSEIIEGLYYTKGKSVYYDFSAIEADVLGNIYEQYLGHILRKTEKRAKLNANNAHRKKRGIYYTPTYIVDYIVRNTLGELLKNNKIRPEKIRALDPACGSGSFLIKAFDVLNEHYLKNDKNYNQTELDFKTGTPFTTKVKIVQNNIFGVDLDKQAVEMARLNLLLKLTEKGRRLPLLQRNIKCGNSLIDSPDIGGDKTFKWEEEFPDIMDDGGFDVVIGNPPWGADIDEIVEYLGNKYPNSTRNHKDIYKCFIERALCLLKEGGMLSFIVPNTFLFQPRYKDIRRFVKNNKILKIVNLGERVFEEVDAPCCIFVIKKVAAEKRSKVRVLDLAHSRDNGYKSEKMRSPNYIMLEQTVYDKTVDNNFLTFYRKLAKDEKSLGEILDCKDCGIKYQRTGVGMREKGKNDLFERLFYEGGRKSKNDIRYFIGSDLKRYFINLDVKRFMRYDYKKILRDNEIVYFNREYFDKPEKILWRQTADRPVCALAGPFWFANTIQVGLLREEFKKSISMKYLLGLMNSKYFSFFYIQNAREFGRVFPQVKLGKIKRLPVKMLPLDKQRKAVDLVDKMIAFNKRLYETGDKKTDKRIKIEREIEKIDKEIDELVYKIYGVTLKERSVIENSFSKDLAR